MKTRERARQKAEGNIEMKLMIAMVSGLALLGALLDFTVAAKSPDSARAWVRDLEDGRKLAAREGKPLFIVFR